MNRKILYVFISMLFILPDYLLADEAGEFTIKLDKTLSVNFNRFFINALPGEKVDFEVTSKSGEVMLVNADFKGIIDLNDGKWEIEAPLNPGTYFVEFSTLNSTGKFKLTLFVLTPFSEINGGYLNNYKIGNYPENGYKNDSGYNRPPGFIEVTEKNKDIFISPHFQLKQFLCKQKSEWPKYLIIDPLLIVKLELLLSELNKGKQNIKTLFIMSGYRTPYYNKLIGNVKYSRHIYGNAADVYVDIDSDGVIDDLNNDGKNDMADELILYKIINTFDKDPKFSKLLGGVGKYRKNPRHTYFIHIDTRGYRARW